MTNKNKYPSKYSNGKFVSAAQFITEIICERIAKKNKKDLHYRFWLSPDWEKEYKGQIAAANKLLNRYEFKVIVAALKSKHGLNVYSLRAKYFEDIIKETEKLIQKTIQPQAKIINRNILDKGKAHQSTKNIIDKLKELE